ncbi:MAG: zinc ABC transporter substrate-binding protein [Gammaproteobacteria bacterium]|nr:MAG: zinc ABC transporter substrate-binding protein [Gammaproteobacteria bacterium]RLA62262.1 MAG: zinc ABC transporter substrate-binding protein [Gammaproteobacteria bacterium]
MRLFLALALFILTACEQGQDSQLAGDSETAGRAPLIYTVNYPLAWMAQQLAGDAARVMFPAPAEDDPAFWQPDVATVLQYQQADLVLLNGANYARWVANVSLPASRLVDTSAAYREQLIAVDSDPVHSHGPAGEHSHGELAFTTWLDMGLAQLQLQAVTSALQHLMPGESAVIEQRLAALQQKLATMDQRLLATGRQLDDIPLLYSHPVYQYLQRRYHLNGRAVHWEPDKVPSETQWSALESLLRSHPAQVMLWEAPPLPEVELRLNKLGVKTVVFSPMGNRPPQGDFNSGMVANIARLEQL